MRDLAASSLARTRFGSIYAFYHTRVNRWKPELFEVLPTYSRTTFLSDLIAGLTVGLGAGWDLVEAIALGARCGAQTITARGGLRGQLTDAIVTRQ